MAALKPVGRLGGVVSARSSRRICSSSMGGEKSRSCRKRDWMTQIVHVQLQQQGSLRDMLVPDASVPAGFAAHERISAEACGLSSSPVLVCVRLENDPHKTAWLFLCAWPYILGGSRFADGMGCREAMMRGACRRSVTDAAGYIREL